MLKLVDLFAGTGGFSQAFKATGQVEVVYANDMVPASKAIYDANNTHPLTLGNLNDIAVEDIPPHDILTGGFPCQPFSIAGHQLGFEDVRSNVFWTIMKIVDARRPRAIVLENVKNLVTHDTGKTFTTIRKALETRGYNVTYKVLNTAKYTGIPQHRERIYIVALLDATQFSLDFPDVPKQPLTSFYEPVVADKYYYTDRSSTWALVSEAVVSQDTIYQYRRVYVRENKSQECPTLTANMGGGGHNVPLIRDAKGIRKLTPRECFNFQGFPSTYILPPRLSDTDLYKLAGNAISVPIVSLVAHRLVPLLLTS